MPGDTLRKFEVPRWVQLVGLPLLAVGVWLLISAVQHAVFIFVVAALIAILLNPIVRSFMRFRLPRSVAVFLVYGLFAVVLVSVTIVVATVVADQVHSGSDTVRSEFNAPVGGGPTPAQEKLNRLQDWLDSHGLRSIHVRNIGNRAIKHIQEIDLRQYSGKAVSVAQNVVLIIFESLFNVVLVLVISIYMLLDADRLSRYLRRLFPGDDPGQDLLARCERALIAYVRGQLMVSLVIGTTAGLGCWILGVLGIFQNGDDYALAFGAWAATTEIIPYLGPWLGALAPLIVAALESPTAVIAVAALFLFIHQIEGHIVIPKLMGGAVGVHPLGVIFALLAATELYGLAGVLVALPLVAIGREVVLFLRERITLESWQGRAVPVGIPVEVEIARPEPAGGAAPSVPEHPAAPPEVTQEQ